MARTLAGLSRGQTATIAGVEGDDAIAWRILEMGLTDGEEVTCLGAAPLGDPLEFSVRGYRISLRAAEANRVRIVDRVDTPASPSGETPEMRGQR